MKIFKNIDEIIEIIQNHNSSISSPSQNSAIKDFEGLKKKAVVGIDILQYSQFKSPDQIFIPFVFYEIFKETIKGILIHEKFLFQDHKYEEILEERFISTGDGGFLILENPLEALLFALYFESYLRNYNSKRTFADIFSILGPIKVRYGICYDEVYKIQDQKNMFGAGIIHCARIMAKDKLDRCLIDENTYNWFLINLNGIESLRHLPYHRLTTMPVFCHLKPVKLNNQFEYNSYALSNKDNKEEPGIDMIMAMKIGNLKVKSNTVSVYNIFIQMPYIYHDEPYNYFVVTLGNNNADGLSD